tara:strand:- start:484 stop:1080 length:597 start_codon:yes stop_codon:yes gene_type:complete
MIEFKNLSNEEPYIIFKTKYLDAINAGQTRIEAISISTYNKEKNEVDSRFVNLKFVDGEQFIFFSNYNSPKSIAFNSHDQISALIYWASTDVQIRMKAKIKKTSIKYNKEYFKSRSYDKNALAISSNQSNVINSYDDIRQQYDKTSIQKDLSKCPTYWGGFSFVPYYFEFWEGHKSRINKRLVLNKVDEKWKQFILEP